MQLVLKAILVLQVQLVLQVLKVILVQPVATGADGKNAEADVKDNGNGTHTVTIKDGNGNTTTIIKDGCNWRYRCNWCRW